MRVALVHDWLTGFRGGEKCLIDFLALYPNADIYTLFYIPNSTSKVIDERVVATSFLQKIPQANRHYKLFLPFYSFAAQSLKLDGYDLVISLSHAASKNVRILNDALHISYCFTPMRYIWDQAPQYWGRYLNFAWPLIKFLRLQDLKGNNRVDSFIGISSFIAARIRCFYGRRADVLYPAVNTEWIKPAIEGSQGKFFLYAGAIVPYKRVDLVVAACTKLNLPLYIANEPNDTLRRLAGPTVKFLGKPSNSELAELYRECRALIFPVKEDFGMVPIECMAAGRPVICLAAGGTKETVKAIRHWKGDPITEHPSGVFIHPKKDLLESLLDALNYFIANEDQFSVADCITQASRFAPENFFAGWQVLLTKICNRSRHFNNRLIE